jgi:acyl carrier protein
MNEGEIHQALTEVFRELFDDDSLVLSPSTTAADIPDWDSQNHINLILMTEGRFGIRFRTAELDSLRNVGEFLSLIQSKLAGSPHADRSA